MAQQAREDRMTVERLMGELQVAKSKIDLLENQLKQHDQLSFYLFKCINMRYCAFLLDWLFFGLSIAVLKNRLMHTWKLYNLDWTQSLKTKNEC